MLSKAPFPFVCYSRLSFSNGARFSFDSASISHSVIDSIYIKDYPVKLIGSYAFFQRTTSSKVRQLMRSDVVSRAVTASPPMPWFLNATSIAAGGRISESRRHQAPSSAHAKCLAIKLRERRQCSSKSQNPCFIKRNGATTMLFSRLIECSSQSRLVPLSSSAMHLLSAGS